MVGTILVVLLVLAVGSRATDGLRLRQQETILERLPQPEAIAYYKILRRRVWTVRALRAVTLLSVLTILYLRTRGNAAAPAPATPAATATAPAPAAGQGMPPQVTGSPSRSSR